MSLQIFIFTTLFFNGIYYTGAFANPLDNINREHAICFGKSYTPDQMKEHPSQTVTKITVNLSERPEKEDPTIYMKVDLALKEGSFSANLICDRKEDKLACAVECDGGQAEVQSLGDKSTQVLFLNKGFYLSPTCDGEAGNPIFFPPTANGDDIFQLNTVPCN